MTEHDPKHLQNILQDTLIPQNFDLVFKSMFGGIMAYVHGQPFVSLSNVGLAIKLSPADQTELLTKSEAKRLQYEIDSAPSKSYILVPETWLTDPDQMMPWLLRSAEYVKTRPAKKKPGKKKPTTG